MSEVIGGRYKIIRKVGGGGMAVVYLAEDISLGRKVALKVLRDQYTEDPDFARHFHKEARAVATLNHPNIVDIYDFDVNSQPAYIVMEFVHGPTVKEMIQNQGRLSAEEAAEIAIQVAYGLEEAHKNQIVHKDIKSHNIMVNKDGHVRITDFGISQMLSNTTITHNKAILGSAHYFSPEQARGEPVSYASDIYSLGVVMYEMITGQVPFIGENPVTVALKHIQEAPADPRTIVPNLPEGMANIILTCLEKEPSDRFVDMEALANALRNFLQGDSPGEYACAAYTPSSPDVIAVPSPHQAPARDKMPDQAYPENPKEKKKKPLLAYALVGFLIFLTTFITIFAVRQLFNTSDILAPNVEQMSYEKAANALRRNNLNIAIDGEEPSDEVAEGYVIRQSPPPGTPLQEGATVGVIVSTGSEEIEVPDVRDMTLEEAQNTLEARNLVVGTVTEAHDKKIDKGRIVSQGLLPGDKVAKGEEVDLVVSLGEEEVMVSVPDLRGQTQASARDILSNAKLDLGQVTEAFHESVGKGLVISQSINPGQKMKTSSSVDIILSKGPEEKPNPEPAKRVNLSFDIPQNGTVSIVRDSVQGKREVYSGPMREGDRFSQDYEIQGSGRFLIYLNGELIDEVAYGK